LLERKLELSNPILDGLGRGIANDQRHRGSHNGEGQGRQGQQNADEAEHNHNPSLPNRRKRRHGWIQPQAEVPGDSFGAAILIMAKTLGEQAVSAPSSL
jgi:hypothetical protein